MSNPTSNFGWQMPTNTDLVTDLPADFEVFGQGVDTTLADLKGGTTGQILSKASNTDMDFTWTNLNPGDITGVTATSPLTGGGTSGDVTIGIQSASTSQSGAVQLSDSTSTTSSVLAATPTAVKSAYDLAAAAVPKSTVTTNGDLIVGTGSATVSRLGIGSNGTVLTSNGTTASWTAPASTGVTYPINPVLNSNFSVWQRGASFASATSNTYTADRWSFLNSGAGAYTLARQATSDATNLPNIQYCMRFQRNSGQTATNVVYLTQSMESVNSIPYAGKTITFSFYARAGANYSSASSILSCNLSSGTGTDQNINGGFTGSATVITQNATLTTTWQRFTYTGSVASTATQIGFYFNYTPVGTAGAADYFEVTGVQIDVGSTAQAYRPNGETYQAELAACQRYYYRVSTTSSDITARFGPSGAFANTTTAYLNAIHPVTMRRTAISVEFSNLYLYDFNGDIAITNVILTANCQSTQTALLTCSVASGGTQYRPVQMSSNGTANGYIGITAEL
jgi:hypothetical protein